MKDKDTEQFMRIAMAVIGKKRFPYTIQRRALAAKLYTKHLKRKKG
jgi:hypothetical protein